MFSQNGYKAKDYSLIASYTVPGTDGVRVSLRKGDVSVVLLYLLEQYHRFVEPLRKEDTGGYNPRSIVGAYTLSNHASGTAVDTRWQKHPIGRRNTFTPEQERTIRKILIDLNGVVRWGGNYRGRPDEMHFEVIGSPAEVKRVADRIRSGEIGGPRVKPVTPKPVVKNFPAYPGKPLEKGMENNKHVAIFQAKMKARGWKRMKADGDFGDITKDLVTQFQREKGLKTDGIVGPKTWKAIFTAK